MLRGFIRISTTIQVWMAVSAGTKQQTITNTAMSRTVVLEALRKTKKGNLKYDSTWHSDGNIKDIIRSAASPPPLPRDLVIRSLEKLRISDSIDQADSLAEPSQSDDGSKNTPTNDTRNGKSDQESPSRLSSSYSDEIVQAREQRTARIQVALRTFEEEVVIEAQERNKDRRERQEAFSRHVEREAKQDIMLLEQRTELQRRALWQKINDVSAESEESRERRLLHQQERHRLHVKKLDAKMKEAQLQKELAEQERQKRKRAELQSFVNSLSKVKGQIDDQAGRILQELHSCPHQEQLAPRGNGIRDLIKRLQLKADQLVETARESKPSEQAFQNMTVLIQKIVDLSALSKGAIADAEKLAKEQEAAARAKAASEAAAAAAATKAARVSSAVTGQDVPGGVKGVLSEMANADSLTEYRTLQENLLNVQKSFEQLKQDRDMKTYCFDIRKAINTPVNAISSQSGSHFLGKLRRIQQLLNGQQVEVGNKTVSAKNHPDGMAFCKDLLAKKIVKQGQEQVSSNYESAFPFAALAVGLWSQHPDIGDLILANFHQQCPFLVPYHMAKREDQSNQEYYKLLGYLYDSEGGIEKQDKYLKRMSGYTRLYAAILVSVPPPGCGQVNPFGREKAWQWLSRLLNLEPQPDITATMLFDFLEVCGFALAETYKKQFFKLIQALIRGYFPKIEAVTPKGSGGPVMRLKSYLQSCLQSQKFPRPAGLLSPSFWRS